MNAISTAWASLKAATARLTMHWSRGESWGLTWLTGTAYDYQKAAGDGRTNAAVMCCVRWVQRALPEAPLIVMQRNADGEMTPAPEHSLQALIERPNDHYSGLHLIGALVADLMLTGNAYLLKVRSGAGRPVALWWVPSTMIEPRWNDDGTEFIGWYDYTVDGQKNRIDQHDVVHIRQGFDPRNIRKGLSDLECLFREIATDNEAAQMSATLLRNQAVPGVILSPEGNTVPTQSDLEAAKNNFMSKFGGDRRGEPMIMAGPTKVSVLSWSPEQMNLRSLRQIPEERITAVFGIPAAVVGLGTGLEQTKVGATMSESREQAYESCLIPLQRLMMAELQMQLVPDFGDPARLRVQFDLSEVRVLQDDQNALHERARADLLGGLLTLNQALTMIGEEPVDGEQGDVRYLPTNVTVKTLDTLIPEAQPAALVAPTPLRALPAPTVDEAAAGKGGRHDPLTQQLPGTATASAITGRPAEYSRTLKAAALSDDDLLARYDAGLSLLSEDLADDLLGAFEEVAEAALGRVSSFLASKAFDRAADAILLANGRGAAVEAARERELKAAAIDGLVTLADHEPIQRLLRSYVLKSFRQAAEDLAPLTDGPVRIQRNTPAVKAAIAEMEARMPGIAATTGEDFGRLIRRLERRPGSVPLADVRAALTEYIADTYTGRAEAIARTELGYAHAAGVIHVAEKSGIAARVAIHDGTDDGPCLIGGTVVSAVDVRKGYDRWFVGEVITLTTAAGNLLTATPNHPILTSGGWVAAGLLKEGDDVIRSLDSQRIAALVAINGPHSYHGPSAIEKMADLSLPADGRFTVSKPCTPENFHGDGVGSDVYAVSAAGDLGGDADSIAEKVGQHSFIGSIETAAQLSADRLQGQFLLTPSTSSGCLMSRSSTAPSSLGGQVLVSQNAGVLRTADRNTGSSERVAQVSSAISERSGDLVDALSAQVSSSGFGNISHGISSQPYASGSKSGLDPILTDMEGNRDALDALASLIEPTCIVGIERSWFEGHVYNLETEIGWYVAEGIVTHNCKERNGTTATLEEARSIGLQHPNCQLRLIPIIEAA